MGGPARLQEVQQFKQQKLLAATQPCEHTITASLREGSIVARQ